MSIALSALVLDLQKRIEALERTVTASPRRLGVLYAQAAAKKAQGEALKAEIAALMREHPGQKAYVIWSHLTRAPRPKLRRIQQVMRALRNTADVAPDAGAPAGTHRV